MGQQYEEGGNDQDSTAKRWRPSDSEARYVSFPVLPYSPYHYQVTCPESGVNMRYRQGRDPWRKPSEENFWLKPSELLAMARANPPAKPGRRVTDFTSWLLSLYTPPPSRSQLEAGRDAEKAVFVRRPPEVLCDEFGAARAKGFSKYWIVEQCGMALAGADEETLRKASFPIPSLLVDGEPIWGLPDLVLCWESDPRQKMTVEIKFSMAPIPANLWPNIWAQLWAYARIPSLRPARVVGEVWGANNGPWRIETLGASVYLRRSVERDPCEPKFDRFFSELFQIYGGELLPVRDPPGKAFFRSALKT